MSANCRNLMVACILCALDFALDAIEGAKHAFDLLQTEEVS